MFDKNYEMGESKYEHLPKGLKLPKPMSATELMKKVKEAETEKAEQEKTPENGNDVDSCKD
jgi:hypothetical protein